MSPLRRAGLCIAVAIGLGSSEAALAAFSCYQVGGYPAVFDLSLTRGHLTITLPQRPGDQGEPDMQINQVLIQGDDGSWKTSAQICTEAGCRTPDRIRSSCALDVPTPQLSLDEMRKIAPDMAEDTDTAAQNVGACVEHDGIVWFGVVFYCGEGECGLGGIGRYDTRTHQLKVRRPKLLLASSVSPIAFDGKYVWAGTFSSGECIGDDPQVGMVRYDWDADSAVSFGGGTDSGGDPDGPCGFRFNDIYIDKQGLWASSDMGLALLTNPQAAPSAMHWENYVPAPGDAHDPLLKTNCRDLYAHLVATLSKTGGGDEYDSIYGQFTKVLGRFNARLEKTLLKQ